MCINSTTKAGDGVVPDLRSILHEGDEIWVRATVVEVNPWDMTAPAKVAVKAADAEDFESVGDTAQGWMSYWDIKLKERGE